MFSRNRRWLAAAGLMAALFLAAPAPTLAAGLWEPPADLPGLVIRAWSWLERLGVVRRVPEPAMAVREKEGAMIDPNGTPLPTDPPPPSSSSALSSIPRPDAGGW